MAEYAFHKITFTMGSYIRSIILLIITTLLIPPYGIMVMCAIVLPVRYRHALIRSYLHIYLFLLKYICHLDYVIEGKENIPTGKNGIIFAKHQSTWETFFLPTLFHNPAIILKKELLYVPFFGWGLAAADPIAINRSRKHNAMQQIIVKGTRCLRHGRWVLIFPEGTRTPYGTAGHYKLGGARLAAKSGYFVLPVAHDAGYFWPRRTLIKRRGTIRIVIGPPIETHDKTPEDIMNMAKDWIETTMIRIDRLIDKQVK